MKKTLTVLTVILLSFSFAFADRVDVYPQSFEAGGWKLDTQFMDVMGSAYLLAHGIGNPVADAKAKVTFPKTGKYRVWVRTRNWADGAPGKFNVLINGIPLAKTFGEGKREWGWEDGGIVDIKKSAVKVSLRDLTGFDGRCAGVVFASDGETPDGALKINEADVAETIKVDFVVVGGGLPGTCAAVAAARRGLKVALVQDRPMLGGNASSEVRVWCAGEMRYDLVRELRGYFMNRSVNTHLCDDMRMGIVSREKNLSLHVSTRAFGVDKKSDGTIAAVKALDLKGNRVLRFEAPLFCDATGDGWIGYWAGADWRMGREAKKEFGESMAPDKADGDTLGASLMWTSSDANAAVPFSAPWAEKHAQGVVAVNGEWNWEYGIHRDMIQEAEAVRDRLFLAIYGSFSLAKRNPKHANKVLNFVPYILGKRESRRILGDWIYSEKDVTKNVQFEDSIASGSWGVDLHYDDFKKGVDFLTSCRQPRFGRYWIPYRSIYSRNVGNLFMVGRCFSCTHVGLGGPRVINTLSQLGVAAGEAAAMCIESKTSPRGIYKNGLVRKLQDRLGGGFPGVPDKKTEGWFIVDDESKGVKFGKNWRRIDCYTGEQVGNVAHRATSSNAGDAVYPLPVPKSGHYDLMFKVPYFHFCRPGGKTAIRIENGSSKTDVFIDQGLKAGYWRKIGTYYLSPGAKLRIIPSKSKGRVEADGFALVPVKAPVDISSKISPVPKTAVMKDEGYFVRGGSIVKDEKGVYHLFYARWKKEHGMSSGWATDSEIARAEAPSPFGPWEFKNVVFPSRGAQYWDGLCTHNPTVHKFDGKYYLYYMGNTRKGAGGKYLESRNNQRIGVAVADSPVGPWKRFDSPILNVSDNPSSLDALMVSNATVTRTANGEYLMIYKSVAKNRPLPTGGPIYYLSATSKSPLGPFKKQMKPCFSTGLDALPVEDPCLWTQDGKVYALVKCRRGFFGNGNEISIKLFEMKKDGEWVLSAAPVVLGQSFKWESGKTEKFSSVERPQIYFENGKMVALCVAVVTKNNMFNVQIPLK
jgi:hypothetical protein